MSHLRVDRAILKDFVLCGVKHFLSTTPHYPSLSIQHIFNIIAGDISGRVATRSQIGGVFYELIDTGKVPQLKSIRDQAARAKKKSKKDDFRKRRKVCEKERRERDILTLHLALENAGVSKSIMGSKHARISGDTRYSSLLLHPRPSLRRLYQKQHSLDIYPLQDIKEPTQPLTLPKSLQDSPPETAQIRERMKNAPHLKSSIPYKDQREFLESMHRLCLYSCFDFCKIRLKHDITRNIDDPISSLLGLSTLINVIISVWNSGMLDPNLIDEDVGFGSGNAFERASCVVDSMIYKSEMSDRRLLSVLQAGGELMDAVMDEERLKRADLIYGKAERLIAKHPGVVGDSVEIKTKYGESSAAMEREEEDTEMEDEDS